jgi:hypothetical protein
MTTRRRAVRVDAARSHPKAVLVLGLVSIVSFFEQVRRLNLKQIHADLGIAESSRVISCRVSCCALDSPSCGSVC